MACRPALTAWFNTDMCPASTLSTILIIDYNEPRSFTRHISQHINKNTPTVNLLTHLLETAIDCFINFKRETTDY